MVPTYYKQTLKTMNGNESDIKIIMLGETKWNLR